MSDTATDQFALRPHLVLGFTFLIACFGVFASYLLFLFPLGASLTLSGLNPRVRIVVAAVSAGMTLLGLLLLVTGQ